MTATYDTVCTLINKKDYTQAESLLHTISSKDGTWHYFYGQLMVQKSWFDSAKMHFEKAIELSPESETFKDALVKLMARCRHYSHDYYDRRPYRRRSGCCCCCCDDCCCELDCCDLICLDSCCECMGGDLISCI
ncbi:MAG: tetratricopeptide repeat protein [Cellulosilyticaceae bacterium]